MDDGGEMKWTVEGSGGCGLPGYDGGYPAYSSSGKSGYPVYSLVRLAPCLTVLAVDNSIYQIK